MTPWTSSAMGSSSRSLVATSARLSAPIAAKGNAGPAARRTREGRGVKPHRAGRRSPENVAARRLIRRSTHGPPRDGGPRRAHRPRTRLRARGTGHRGPLGEVDRDHAPGPRRATEGQGRDARGRRAAGGEVRNRLGPGAVARRVGVARLSAHRLRPEAAQGGPWRVAHPSGQVRHRCSAVRPSHAPSRRARRGSRVLDARTLQRTSGHLPTGLAAEPSTIRPGPARAASVRRPCRGGCPGPGRSRAARRWPGGCLRCRQARKRRPASRRRGRSRGRPRKTPPSAVATPTGGRSRRPATSTSTTTEVTMPTSAAGSAAPVTAAAADAASTARKLAGTSHRARPLIAAPRRPTATMAARWWPAPRGWAGPWARLPTSP